MQVTSGAAPSTILPKGRAPPPQRPGGPLVQSSLERPSASPASPGRHLKLLVAGGAIVLGIAYLIVTALQTSTVYYITVGELLQRGPAGAAQHVRVAGDVVPG